MELPPLPSPAAGAQAPAPREPSAPSSSVDHARAPEAVPADDVLKQAIKEIQENVGNTQTNLRFRVDETSGRIIVSVVDAETNQVVRQIPSEEVMRLARVMDRLQGLLINGKA